MLARNGRCAKGNDALVVGDDSGGIRQREDFADGLKRLFYIYRLYFVECDVRRQSDGHKLLTVVLVTFCTRVGVDNGRTVYDVGVGEKRDTCLEEDKQGKQET